MRTASLRLKGIFLSFVWGKLRHWRSEFTEYSHELVWKSVLSWKVSKWNLVSVRKWNLALPVSADGTFVQNP